MPVPSTNMKLPVKVRVLGKKIAFFFFHRLVPPTRNIGGRKRVRSDKTDMPNFLASDLDLYSHTVAYPGFPHGGVRTIWGPRPTCPVDDVH